MTLFEELQWRGLVSETSGNVDELLENEKVTFYVGTDATGSSLHVGHLLAFTTAKLLQSHGHKPIVLVGKATAAMGDPSGKTEERQILTMEQINSNAENIKAQIAKIIDFESDIDNKALMVSNYDWMSNMSFIDFEREVGKHITVNYMMSKESVKKRLSREGCGISHLEFSYMLVQAFDFYHLYNKYNCKLQIGGSDQYGNIVTGGDLIRRKNGSDSRTYGLVWPLVTRADGKKFGKSEGGKNIWLDPNLTSPYQFYQFWFNQSDEDSERFIKMFTMLSVEEIESLIAKHKEQPQLRLLQKRLAEELTIMVHSKEEYDNAVNASKALFDKTIDSLKALDDKTFIDVMDGVQTFEISSSEITNGINIIDLLSVKTNILSSKGNARKAITANSIAINKNKISDASAIINAENIIHNNHILVQSGKKNMFLINVVD